MVFLYQLVFILNQTAADFAHLAVLRSLVLSGHLNHLVTDPLSEDVAARRAEPEAARQLTRPGARGVRRSRNWSAMCGRTGRKVRTRRDLLRWSIGALRRGGGRLDALGEQADRLDTIVETLREPFRTRAGFGLRHVLPAKQGLIADRARSRVAELADDARIARLRSSATGPGDRDC